MMDLYVLRHAIAVPHGEAGYEKDSDRPLTAKGAKKMRKIARGMASLGIRPDVILSSPLPRARQTAEIAAGELGLEKRVRISGSLAVGGDHGDLIREINEQHASAGAVMIVGHEPYLSGLISVLLSDSAGVDITMKKGGLCKVQVDTLRHGRCGRLEWLLTPAMMVRLG
jgi:phosphohistidine phosphatase